MTWTKYPTTPDVSIRTDNLSLVDTEGNKTRVYGEDETVFLTVDLDIVDTTGGVKKAITEVTGVYTGVQNVDIDIDVDDIQAVTEGQVYTVYDSDWYVIGRCRHRRGPRRYRQLRLHHLRRQERGEEGRHLLLGVRRGSGRREADPDRQEQV